MMQSCVQSPEGARRNSDGPRVCFLSLSVRPFICVLRSRDRHRQGMHNAKQLSLGRRVQSIGLFRILDVTTLHP